MLIVLLLLSSYLFSAEPPPLRLTSNPSMSQSRLHLERIITDTENLKHRTRTHTETSTIDIRDEDLGELTAQIYFQDENHPLREYIRVQLRRKIAAAKLREDTKSSYGALEALLEKKKRHSIDLLGAIEASRSEEHTSDFIHRLVMEAIEDAFVEKQNLIDKEKKDADALASKLHIAHRQMKIAIWGIVASTATATLATVAIMLGVFLGKGS